MTLEEETISFTVGKWGIINTFLILIVFIGIVAFASSYLKINIDTADTEAQLFSYRLFYSKQGISYYSPDSGRIYPQIIDLGKINNNSIPLLEKSITYGADNHLGAKIIIQNLSGDIIKTGIYNPLTYRRIAESGIAGPGGVDMTEKQLYLLAKDNTLIFPVIVNLSIIIERS